MDDFKPYVNDFLVIDVPENQDILQGMPWLKANNPDIDWVEERVSPQTQSDEEALPGKNGKKTIKVKRSVKTPHKPTQPAIQIGGERHPVSLPKTSDGDELFTSGFYSVLSGETNGYYQFRVRDADVPYTAFQLPDGSYEYLVLPMGLSSAPATFNAGVRRVLADLSDICQSYFDDIYVCTKSKNLEEHLTGLDRVLTRLEEHNVYIKLSKCVFCVAEIPCLGNYVGRNDVRIDPAKVEILRDWPLHRDRNELQSFMGRGKGKIEWTNNLRGHFNSLKDKFSSTPVLAIPNFDQPFHLPTDASDFAVEGVLFQEEGEGDDKVERPIAFGGRKYKAAEKNDSIREKELLAILFGLRLWRIYLLNKPFIVETDHRFFETLFSQKTISRRVGRWYDELSEYPITFKYIPGKENTVADGMSRRPDFMHEENMNLAAISNQQDIQQRIDWDITRLMKEAVSRYKEDPFTASLIIELSKANKDKRNKQVTRNLSAIH
ncbi:unnamed protein product [Phytophthora lilii]|uniref:Unnamed protein product n=1 Tax=Phytophthora lilii TaxID=2077276 RepID=A0A9W6TZ71_9STRA|nr:unnamed protein product [Phytophthora lilii]